MSHKPSKKFARDAIYDFYWTEKIDNKFIFFLELLASALERCIIAADYENYLQDVINNLNNFFHTDFTFGDGLYQIKKLKRRLACWSLILVLDNQFLLKVTDGVTADHRIWEYLGMRYSFAKAYQRGIETNAEQLQKIFGRQSVTLCSLSSEMVNHVSGRNMELVDNQPRDQNRNSLFLAGEDVTNSIARDGYYEVLIGSVPDASTPPMGSPERLMGSGPYASNLPMGSPGRRRATHSGGGSSRTPRKGKHSAGSSN